MTAVSRPEFIFIASIMGTGTVFTLRFFEGSDAIGQKRDILNVMNGGFSALQLDPDTVNLIHAHFDGHAASTWDAIRSFSVLASRLVIPIRDPLAVLLLARRRHTGTGSLNAWGQIVEMFTSEAYQPHFLPVDLLAAASVRDRFKALQRVAGEYVAPNLCEDWAEKWPVINSHGDYDLKFLYSKADVPNIREALGQEWDALRQIEPEVRPFLERLGYRKLLWWHDA